MSKKMLFIKTILRQCNYKSVYPITVQTQRFISTNIRVQTNGNSLFICKNINFHSFSSLSKSQEVKGLILAKQTANPLIYHYRTFSLKEYYESTLSSYAHVFQWITESAIVNYAKHFIIDFHDTSGLPWWSSIILTTCILRFVITFPLQLYQSYVIAKLENARKEMDDKVNDIKYDLNREVRRNKWPEKKAKLYFRMRVRKEWTQLVERENCHPAKVSILALFQIPTWVVFSSAFRNIVYKLPYSDEFAELKSLELSVGGVAWFPNLLLPDTFILPLTLGLVNLTIIQINVMLHKGPERSRVQRYLTHFFRGLTVLMVLVAASVPSCLTLYWVTSSTVGLCQNLILLSPRLRRLVGIPPTPSTVANPYSHLAQQIRNKFTSSK